MTLAEWEKFDRDFNNLLLKAYHHWLIGSKRSNEDDKKIAQDLLDETMAKAYSVRSQYVKATVEV
jgi:DNA-directed RNA polymerase specialized sigma24 family protein